MGYLDMLERAPAPTQAPHAGLVAERIDQLFGRQLDLQTCGYLNNDPASAVWCSDPFLCVQNTINSVRGCCLSPIDSCTLATACIPNASLAASCNSDCELDNYTMKCSNVLSPSCFSRVWITDGSPVTQLEWGCTDQAFVTETVYYDSSSASETLNTYEFSFSIPSSSSSSAAATAIEPSPSASIGSSVSAPFAQSTSVDQSSGGSSGGGGGLSQGATIAIAVCAAVVGLAVISLVGFLCWWRKRKNATAVAASQQGPAPLHGFYPSSYTGYAPPPEHPPFDQPPMSAAGPYYSPSAVGGVAKDDVRWSEVDDDRLARMRRFSNDGTVATIDQTVAGRTNDDFRPQGA